MGWRRHGWHRDKLLPAAPPRPGAWAPVGLRRAGGRWAGGRRSGPGWSDGPAGSRHRCAVPNWCIGVLHAWRETIRLRRLSVGVAANWCMGFCRCSSPPAWLAVGSAKQARKFRHRCTQMHTDGTVHTAPALLIRPGRAVLAVNEHAGPRPISVHLCASVAKFSCLLCRTLHRPRRRVARRGMPPGPGVMCVTPGSNVRGQALRGVSPSRQRLVRRAGQPANWCMEFCLRSP
jgi:hypothetical protein